MDQDVLVVIGVGGMGRAIARRQGTGKTILLTDYHETTVHAAEAALAATPADALLELPFASLENITEPGQTSTRAPRPRAGRRQPPRTTPFPPGRT